MVVTILQVTLYSHKIWHTGRIAEDPVLIDVSRTIGFVRSDETDCSKIMITIMKMNIDDKGRDSPGLDCFGGEV